MSHTKTFSRLLPLDFSVDDNAASAVYAVVSCGGGVILVDETNGWEEEEEEEEPVTDVGVGGCGRDPPTGVGQRGLDGWEDDMAAERNGCGWR